MVAEGRRVTPRRTAVPGLGAGIDVTDPEPCPPDSPLWTEPNVILTPHTGGGSRRLAERKIGWFVQNLRRYVEGRPLRGVVDKERGW